MDRDTARWLAGLIADAETQLENGPGLTVEVINNPLCWLQIIPEVDPETGAADGFLLNFPYEHTENPLELITRMGIVLPPGSLMIDWQAGFSTQIKIRQDVPLMALGLLVGDLLEKLMELQPDYDLEVLIDHGY